MSETSWITAVRLAGIFHFVTLGLACLTPIPADWTGQLARLPFVHRRFALAQNFSIGAVIAMLGCFSLFFADELVAGSRLARALCGSTALFWGARLCILPWLGIGPALVSPLLKLGCALLLLECAVFAWAYGWLAVR